MNLNLITPRKSLNKAFLKLKPNRLDIEKFKANLKKVLEHSNDTESEEHHKNLVIEFLKDTYYKADFFINTKGRSDLVIHNGKDAKTNVGVLIEAKKPGNKGEMLKKDNLNTKAFQELLLYYLRERISHKNLDIRNIVATNINEWFIFDAHTFEKHFATDKKLVKQFEDFEEGRLAGKDTSFFYKEIAEPFIASLKDSISFTHFDIRNYEKLLKNDDKQDDKELIALYKLLSPEHLLKLPFANDSNSLDKSFYSELLHIIGLCETKDGGKKLIQRKKVGERDNASLLENAIMVLDSRDKISRLEKPSQYGNTQEERLFAVGLELVITWINRVLFLKLLEAQLVAYHKGDKEYTFLNQEKIKSFDDLENLFFQVLAKKTSDRNEDLGKQFAKVPYLNSSLFEPTEMEHQSIFISNLSDDKKLPICGTSKLKNSVQYKSIKELNTIEYLFEFLNAYDFSSEGAEEIQEENKTLINASVLGLIFEKINGYKDGSFFTPGFITMYMCRETIRRSVVQKFNEKKNWELKEYDELYDRIEDRKEANEIINSLKICDPAVGSGHFLVSALNEIIAIKADLKVLNDKEGKRLKEYQVEVVNDELVVTDEDGLLFDYNPKNKESQRIQETLFHEKQTIIESCLFGVDINPNSVKICRLRLWIELLKNAYYKADSKFTELETLPNIDINIKIGNSLISRFPLDADLKDALKKSKSKWTIESYKMAVNQYQHAKSKEEKREMEKLINDIKGNFRTEISDKDPKKLDLNKYKGELIKLTSQTSIFGMSDKEKKKFEKDVEFSTKKIDKLETEIEEIKDNKIYENAFEWRFEFPEVLSNEGDFVGFDVIIGNPPYIRQEEISWMKPYLIENFKTYSGTADLYVFFVELGFKVMRSNGKFSFIMPNKWMQAGYGKPLRAFFLKQKLNEILDFGDLQVFEEATTYPCILIASKSSVSETFSITQVKTLKYSETFNNYIYNNRQPFESKYLTENTWMLTNSIELEFLENLKTKFEFLEQYVGGEAKRGVVSGLTEAFVIDEEKRNELINADKKNIDLIKPLLLGRDIKSYISNKPNKYLLYIPWHFPLNNQNIIGASIEAEKAFENNFPNVYNHLLTFKEKLKNRNKVETGIRYEWYALQRYASDYYDEFKKPKIMYQKFQVKPCFIFDDEGLYCNDSMWFIPKDDKVLLAILNSRVGWYLISKYCSAIQNGYQLIWQYFGQIPIATGTHNQRKVIDKKVNQILAIKKQNQSADTIDLENEINQLIYQLYELTPEEIQIIESKT